MDDDTIEEAYGRDRRGCLGFSLASTLFVFGIVIAFGLFIIFHH